MGFPIEVPTRTVSCGAAYGFTDGEMVAMHGAITKADSREFVWNDTGVRFPDFGVEAAAAAGTALQFTLPRTDVSGKWRTGGDLLTVDSSGFTHLYVLTIWYERLDGTMTAPFSPIPPFALPAASQAEIDAGRATLDLDTLVPVTSVPAGTVSIPVAIFQAMLDTITAGVTADKNSASASASAALSSKNSAAASATSASGSASTATTQAGVATTQATNAAASAADARTPVTTGLSWTGAVSLAAYTKSVTLHATLTGNVTLTPPTRTVGSDDFSIRLILTQDSTGGRTLSLAASPVTMAGFVKPVLSTAAGAKDAVFLSWDGVEWQIVMSSQSLTPVT